MEHFMQLHQGPFDAIKSGKKTIEMRLNDERRKELRVGDVIEFTNRVTLEKLEVSVENIYYFDTFEELYKYFDKISLGYKEDEIPNPKDMDIYYSKEQQEKYGVIAIKITVVK